MANYEQTILLTVLAGARIPLWTEQTDGTTGSGDPTYLGAPSSAGDGVTLRPITDGVLFADLVVQLRELASGGRANP